jgi:hypothetical protein
MKDEMVNATGIYLRPEKYAVFNLNFRPSEKL